VRLAFHGELLQLGCEISEPTVSRYLHNLNGCRDEGSAKRGLAFLNNHREVIAAFDFFTVPSFEVHADILMRTWYPPVDEKETTLHLPRSDALDESRANRKLALKREIGTPKGSIPRRPIRKRLPSRCRGLRQLGSRGYRLEVETERSGVLGLGTNHRPSRSCSRQCAVQPRTRATAIVGVNNQFCGDRRKKAAIAASAILAYLKNTPSILEFLGRDRVYNYRGPQLKADYQISRCFLP